MLTYLGSNQILSYLTRTSKQNNCNTNTTTENRLLKFVQPLPRLAFENEQQGQELKRGYLRGVKGTVLRDRFRKC